MIQQLNDGNLVSMVHRENLEVEKWAKQVWLDCFGKGSNKNICQCCLDSHGYLLHMRAIQGHSGGNKVDPTLQDNVKIPYNWVDYMYHAVFSHDCSSMIKSCLIAGGKDSKEGRQWIPRANHKRTNLTT